MIKKNKIAVSIEALWYVGKNPSIINSVKPAQEKAIVAAKNHQ